MDFIDIMEYLGLAATAFIFYRLTIYEKKEKTKGHYTRPAWNFSVKKLYAEYEIKRKQERDKLKAGRVAKQFDSEEPKILPNEESSESQLIYGNDVQGNSILIKYTRRRHRVAEVWLVLRLKNGLIYTFPDHPRTKIVNVTPRAFEGSGLKMENLVPYEKWRITYTGMLRRGIAQDVTDNEDDLYFVRMNFIWTTVSNSIFWPYDWSSKLMATSLATEKWRDGQWMNMITKKDSEGYDQFGACQGEVKIYDRDSSPYVDGLLPKMESIELNLPGLRQRRWGPHKNHHLHRTGVLLASIKDGCSFEVGAYSENYGVTHSQFGNVLFPSGDVHPIDWTNFDLASMGEYQNQLPEATIIQVEAGGKKFVIVALFKRHLKIPLFGGSQHECWNAFIVPVEIRCNTNVGYGAAIFWYPKNLREFDIQEIPTKIKRIFNHSDLPSPDKLLLSFAQREAQSVLVSGGKGSSVAILRVIQETKGADFLDKRDRSQQIVNALIDQVSANPLKRSTRVQSLMKDGVPQRGRQRSGSLTKEIFPDPHDFDVPDYHVPQGFIVSVSAMDRHLKENLGIRDRLQELEDVAYERIEGNIQDACKRVQTAFVSSKLHYFVQESIAQKLNQINFDGSSRFAVRSSGVTEDGEESSAAGQNETFLGLRENEEVFNGVLKCWASLYSYQSVQYRKQHIQPVWSSMAVVVQKMVAAESAGVLFSRHPLNGDPSVIVLTANYGLGESVVSAKADPDTFFVKRSYKDDLELIGSKTGQKKLLIQMDDEANVKEVELDEEKRQNLCLSEEIVLKLARLGVIMEKFFGSPRDIEFAITKDSKIYLLQSRPITSLNNFTDFEIIHENDSAIMSANTLLTKANVGEVFLGTMSTFSQSTMAKALDKGVLTNFGKDKAAIPFAFFAISHQHFFMNMGRTHLPNLGEKVGLMDRIGAMSILGYDVYEKYSQIIEIAKYENSFRTKKFAPLLMMLPSLINLNKYMKEMTEVCLRLKQQFSQERLNQLRASSDVLKLFEKGLIDLDTVIRDHIAASNNSIIFQMIAFSILTNKSEKLTMQHRNDIALILGSMTDVESANVPEMIKNIADLIDEANKREEFLAIDNKSAVEWLRENCSPACNLFHAFMERHGHRSMNELDFISKPWSMVPENIIEMIKTNLSISSAPTATSDNSNRITTPNEIVENLKTPLGSIQKFIMKKILPKCQNGVRQREFAKSKLVTTVNEIRRAAFHLSKMMVNEGLLPDQDLFFFLTITEIKDVIGGRNGKLIAKAIRRQRIFPRLDELKFSDVTFGIPRPVKFEVNNNNEPVAKGDVLVEGTPVCNGVVTARACVCKSFLDVKQLQKGDILITYGTDICWSPYFPILSGICTEIGGLISHGAVVAREYGLPCIIGCSFATDIIQHGQKITLDADNGIITVA